MIQINRPIQRIVVKNADILYAHEFLHEIDIKPETLVGQKVVVIPWDVGFGFLLPYVEAQEWMEACKYECPYLDNTYFWMYPLAILTDDETRYGCQSDSIEFSKRGWLVRTISLESHGIDEWDCEIHSYQKSMLGHGFTKFTLPCDGDGSLSYGSVLLSNNDRILVACWLWYNK